MAKQKQNESETTETPATEVLPSAAPDTPFSSEVADIVEQPSGAKIAPNSPVWSVDIPGSLIGKQLVAASNEAEAGEKYKAVSGITKHATPLTATLCDFTASQLPEGAQLFG